MIWNKTKWSYKQFLAVSFGLAVCMLLFCYYTWNKPYADGDIGSIARKTSWLKRNIAEPCHDKDVLAINIAYDKQLVEHTDEYGIPDGHIDVTDREKLYRLFRFLNEHPTYRFIVCDIDFNTDYQTPYDSLLFDLLSRMPRICLSSGGQSSEQLDRITCIAEYQAHHAGDGFLQYKYTTSERQSVPVRMWEEIDHGQYRKHWYGYTRNGRLCADGVIPDMRFTLESTYDENGRKQIYNLGADILTYACTGEGELFEGKILLIGDWTENDMHDTIRAEQPGIAVLYNAYLLLRDGKNTLPWYLLLILLLLFWGVAATAIWNKSDYLSRQMERIQLFLDKHRILKVCLRFVSVMLVLQLICIFTYFVFGRYINILTIGIILTLISFFL